MRKKKRLLNAFKYLTFVAVVFLLTSCGKPKTAAWFFIRNNTDETLFWETNVQSEQSKDVREILLEQGEIECIAYSKELSGHLSGVNMSEYVYNTDAYVKVLVKNEGGQIVLTKEWKYLERNLEGRQIFNENYLSVDKEYGVLEQIIYGYIFTILPEDLEE